MEPACQQGHAPAITGSQPDSWAVFGNFRAPNIDAWKKIKGAVAMENYQNYIAFAFKENGGGHERLFGEINWL